VRRSLERPRVYDVTFDVGTLEEIAQEAKRLDVSLSRVVRLAWKLSREELSRLEPEP
jgi:uncharacterized small protein (TIGR04563 family)